MHKQYEEKCNKAIEELEAWWRDKRLVVFHYD